MSTVVLSKGGAILGGMLLGPVGAIVGGALGAALGAAVDQQLFGPEAPHTKGPRIDDFQLQTASEGSPIVYCMGPENRMAGTIVWLHGPVEVQQESDGGKGTSGGGSHTSYTYWCHLAVAICAGPIVSVKKVWADGAVFYESEPEVSVESDGLWIERIRQRPLHGDAIVHIRASSDGPDLRDFKAGVDVTVSGWSNSQNNGTFTVFNRKRFSNGDTEIRVVGPSTAVIEAAGNTISLLQTLPTYATSKANDVTFYTGTTPQAPDPLIQGIEGADATPGYAGMAYMVVDHLRLKNFGNRIPNFSFLVEVDESLAAGEALERLGVRAGLAPGQVDGSAATGPLRGYAVRGPGKSIDAVKTIATAHDLLARESNGVLSFFPRSNAATVNVEADDLAAHEGGSRVPRVVTVRDVVSSSLPREVNVQYLDADRDYQQGSERERRKTGTADGVENINLGLVMTSDEARTIAKQHLWTAWANRQTIELDLPPSYAALEVNDRISFATGGLAYTVLATRVDRGNNHLIHVEGVVEETQTLSQTATGGSGGGGGGSEIYVPPPLHWEFMDLPPLRDEDVQSPGYYHAACLADSDVEWPGGSVLSSSDGATYALADYITYQATMGVATGALASGPVGYWDRVNTLTVEMLHGTLDSASELDVLNGGNRALVGDEIIAFRNATLVDTNTYELSMLLRGLRNTEDARSGHADGDRFVLLDAGGINRASLNLSGFGSARYLKAIADGGDETAVAGVLYLQYCNSIQPFGVCHVRGVRNADGDLVVTWVRRSRSQFRHFSGVAAPDVDGVFWSYSILDAPGGSPVRYGTSDDEALTYSVADQTADFGSPQSSVTIRLSVYSPALNRAGRTVEVTL